MMEVTSTVAETLISTSKLFFLLFLGLVLTSLVSANYYYNDGSSSLDQWGQIPQFDSHEEIVAQFVAPFIFITVLLKFSLEKALEFTFDNSNERPAPWEDDGPSVEREATVMALAISGMLVASPYWSWIQTLATSIGVLAAGALVLIFLFLIYVFVRP